MARRDIRCQAAVVRDHHVLLLRIVEPDGSTFWLAPGGGREGAETAAEAVCRELFEETSLTVQAERLLLVTPDMPGGTYDFVHTYLCRIESGIAQPGVHPACDPTIREVGWFDLTRPCSWPELVTADPITFPWLQRLRAELGYA